MVPLHCCLHDMWSLSTVVYMTWSLSTVVYITCGPSPLSQVCYWLTVHFIPLSPSLLTTVSSTLYGTEDVWGFSEASPTPFVWGTTSTNVTMATTTDSTAVTKVDEQVAGFHDDDKQSKFVIASSDTIDSVLNRLSLSDHLPLFKVCVSGHSRLVLLLCVTLCTCDTVHVTLYM